MNKHNTKIFKTLLLLIITSNSYAQFFGLLEKDPAQYYTTALSKPNDGKYRVLSFLQTPLNLIHKAPQILVYNQYLQFEDSINLPNGVAGLFDEPLKVGAKLFWPALMMDTINNNLFQQRLIILELDTNYHHLATHEISSFENQMLFSSNLLYLNNNYYLSKNIAFGGNCKIYKLNNQFSKLDSVVYPNAWIQQIHSVNNNLLIKGLNLPSPCSSGNNPDKLVIDTSFNIVCCFPFTNFGLWSTSSYLLPISKTKFFVSGNTVVGGFPNPSYEALANTIFDNNDQIIQTQVFQFAPEQTSYIDNCNSAAVKNNEIITTGCRNHNPSLGLIQPQNSWVFVNKLDTMGNIIWQKSFGGDMFYRPRSIVFTQDGGCLVAGLRYDTASAVYPGIMESFLLKLDWYGNISGVGIFENSKLNESPIKCFPNPAMNELFFDLPFQEAIEIKLLDVFGKEILIIKNYNNLNSIDISRLASGMYLYQIKTKNKTYSGKFVRE